MSKSCSEEGKSTYNFSNIMIAEPGKKIDMNEVVDLIEESKNTGVPFAKLMNKVNNAKASTIVSPSSEIINHHKREGGRGSKKSNRNKE